MIIKSDRSTMQSYLEDASGLLGGFADLVVIPENEEELAQFLKDASSRRVPVTVSGGGTGVTGGRIAFGGAVVSLEAFNRIKQIKSVDKDRAVATAEAAVSIRGLKEAAIAMGFMYPPDPTEQSSSIGGTISTNASGGRGFKYGPTRNYVTRIKVVLSTGDILNVERGRHIADENGVIEFNVKAGKKRIELPGYRLPDIKNAAGYKNDPGTDLIDVFIGHEGTLGVITEVDVTLLPHIDRILSGVAFFPNSDGAVDFVSEIKHRSGITREKRDAAGIDAVALEYFDSNALELLKSDYGDIPNDARAAIFFEQEMPDRSGEGRIIESWAQVFQLYGLSLDTVWFGTTKREEKIFREFRHRLPEKVNDIVRKNGFPKAGTDIAVPDEKFKEIIGYLDERLKSSGMRYLIFGHIGECHMHANILPKNEEEFTASRNVYSGIVDKAIELGGTVSAEHGIGKLKHRYLERMIGREGMLELAKLKKALDPAMILGQDNIFPKELLENA